MKLDNELIDRNAIRSVDVQYLRQGSSKLHLHGNQTTLPYAPSSVQPAVAPVSLIRAIEVIRDCLLGAWHTSPADTFSAILEINPHD
jgi:hypothetical protein